LHENPHSPDPHQTPRMRAAIPARTPKHWALKHCARRRCLVIAGLMLSFIAGYLLSAPAESSRQQATSVEILEGLPKSEPVPARPNNLKAPTDTRSPKQVVEIQMDALSAYRHNRATIHQVFAHASPANRAVAGPLEKFERMILQPRYHALVVSKHHMIGQAVERGKVAAVLVTTVDEQGRMSVFRFFLSRQSDTYSGCWMTDGVFRLVGNWRPGEALPGVEQKLLESI